MNTKNLIMKKIILTLCAIVFTSVMVQAQDAAPKDDAAAKAYYQQKIEKAKKADATTAATAVTVEKKVDPNNPPSNNEAEKKRLTELNRQAALNSKNKPDTRTKVEREKDAKAKIDN
jgi:hypothetical protein